MSDQLLQVSNLNAFFFSREQQQLAQSLFDINFELYRGETLGIIGESGSGKTVTLLSLMGLLDAQPGVCSGNIEYKVNSSSINVLQNINEAVKIDIDCNIVQKIEKDHAKWEKIIEPQFKKIRGKMVSMVFQNPRLAFNPYISIGKQINESIRLNTNIKNKNIAKEKAIEWLAAVKMDAPHIRYNNNPYGLSGGMCQRAMIAMALAAESDIIIADEPTSGLDATIQSEILDLMIELKSNYNKSMIIVSHDLSVMRKISDKVVVYYKGHIIETGTAHEVLNNANKVNHPYTASMISASSNKQLNAGSMAPIQQSAAPACPYYAQCKDKTAFADRCFTQKPVNSSISSSHQIACWKYHDG